MRGTTIRGEIRRLTRSGDSRGDRPYLVDDPGVSRDGLRTVAYWIAGEPSEGGDAVRMRTVAEATEEGLDVTDPAVLQSLEFS
ncbi:hypothetical protein ACIA58_29360 [Kribbella sp. NPDC051586]|uniref:hypothetical protein n=1 Tax=Kribbella sp. NPDC051586 TaxID=3364118 RepID=UPI0037906538